MRGPTYKFLLEGWEKRSVWGFDEDTSTYWADLWLNDDSDADKPTSRIRDVPTPMTELYSMLLNITNADPDHLDQLMEESMR
ncbi:hypothetical protein ABT061_40385 [Streptosporangium sp. NPDC002544]|uniref:hypothetical protein n=1 Tax=Streptosporangium sp. NPDC002544 TaxID=3154538 RepID=UPI0033244BA2